MKSRVNNYSETQTVSDLIFVCAYYKCNVYDLCEVGLHLSNLLLNNTNIFHSVDSNERDEMEQHIGVV